MNYDEKLTDITDMLKKINDIYMDICRTDSEKAYLALSKVITDIAEIMSEFIGKCELLVNYGVDIPTDVLLAQLQNLLDGFEHRDFVMMADTLHYEIADSLQLYSEIIMELKKENIQI